MTFVSLGPHLPEVELTAAVFAPPSLNYRAEVLADNPNGFWLDDLADQANKAGVLTAVGSPPTTASIIPTDSSLAYDLDGSTQYFTAADGTYTDLGDTFTLEAWVSRDGTSDTLFSKGANSFQFRISSGAVPQLTQEGGASIVAATVSLSFAITYHVAVTKSGSTVKLYRNGVDVTGTVTNATLSNTGTALNIGRLSTGGENWDGRIQAPAIYPTELTQSRLLAHYEAGNPTWYDLTPYLRDWDWFRGRQKPVDRASTGFLNAVLDNRTRIFDPTYVSGPFYGYFEKAWAIRLRERWNSVVYDRWYGYKEKLDLSWPAEGFDATATLRAVDAFKALEQGNIGGNTYSVSLAGTQIGAILDDVGFSGDKQDVQTGQTYVAGVEAPAPEEQITRSAPLERLHLVEEADDGFLFTAGTGKVTYQDGLHRVLNSGTTSATVGETTGTIRYEPGPNASHSDEMTRNNVSITPTGGVPEVVTDEQSIRDEWEHAYNRELLTLDQGYAVAYAQHQVQRYGRRQLRVPSVTLKGASGTTMWPQVLGLELSDRVTFVRGGISTEQYIEGIGESAGKERDWKNPVSMSLALDSDVDYRFIDSHNINAATVFIY